VKRTILFATEYWPPFAPGGAEWTNVAWAEALARRGHRVVVITPNYGASSREEHAGVLVVRAPFAIKLRPGQQEASWLLHRNPLFHVWFERWTRRVAESEGCDIVHAQNKGALVGAWRAARALRRPLAVTVRDVGLLCPVGACTLFEPWTTFECTTQQYVRRCVPFFLARYASGDTLLRRTRRWSALLAAWIDHARQRRALADADLVIGVSRGILALFPPALVARARVVHSLPPRLDAVTEDPATVRARFGIGDGPLVLYAGKRSFGKGTEVLIAALRTLRAAVPGVQFVFAGKGDVAPPPGGDVHVLGSVPQPTLFALYRAADVVVVPSVWPEPLSRVLLESMRLGRAVVASRVGGSAELVEDGVTGVLVERGDPEALARAVVGLLCDPERRARLGASAARHTETEFDEDRLVATLLDAYDDVLVRRPHASRSGV
jgi:glycosyltransferase involved in cell wall biosynthesis